MKQPHRTVIAPVTTLVAALAFAALVGGGGCGTAADCSNVATFGEVSAFAKCTSCHSSTLSGADRQDAPSDINFDTYASAVANAGEAREEIEEGAMPPAGSDPLTDDEKAQIEAWAGCGTPE